MHLLMPPKSAALLKPETLKPANSATAEPHTCICSLDRIDRGYK
jgi:hypothetical protein